MGCCCQAHPELPKSRLRHTGVSWLSKHRIEHVTSQDIIDAINGASEAIGWDRLGVKKGDFETHSISSGGAMMAMYLDEIPIYTIMFTGRWSSNAWLCYISKK
jgi:hypothetical protein